MSYRLKDGVYLAEGASRGALLDTNRGLVYSVNRSACTVINHREVGKGYWAKLVEMGIAESADSSHLSSLPAFENTSKLKFIWLEVVTDDCNERCLHCYADSMPRTYRKEQGFNIKLPMVTDSCHPNMRMNHEDWLRVIQEAYDLGCRKGQLIGGEPFLYKGKRGESLLDLAEYMVRLGFTMVEIYTNATLLTKRKIARIKDLGLQMAVSLYSDDSEIHDEITRTPGSHAKTVEAIRELNNREVPTRVETVIMRNNQHTVEATLQFKEMLGVEGKHPDPLRPKGRGDDPFLQPSFETLVRYGLMLIPNFDISKEKLAHYSSRHPCLLGKVTVTEFGNVLPCIFSRNNIVGNVLLEGSLANIIHGTALTEIWKTTKDKILVCQDCEYRYACFDCRPLAEGVAAGRGNYLDAPYPRCTYNPYTGEWAQGLWRINDKGEPYYDRRHALEIQAVASTMIKKFNGTN